MGKTQDIKIRTIPRSAERSASPVVPNIQASQSPQWIVYAGTLVCLGVLMALIFPRPLTSTKPTVVESSVELSSVSDRLNDTVGKYMQEAALKREMMVRSREIENLRMPQSDLEEPALSDLDEELNNRILGVQLDQEDSAARVFKDLNGSAPNSFSDQLPDERINSRLANRRWVNELERNQRINFVRNFIRSAYERGYEVQLDQNLVVVSVKRISKDQKVNIDQVVDRLARQGL